MTDQRPQYGEFATPEEQRRAAGLPPLDQAPHVMVEEAPIASAPDAPDVKRSHPVDRVLTIGMLAYGLINVVMTGLSYLDFASAMNQVMGIVGVEGEFTNYAQGRLWGTIAAIVLVAGWSLTAAVSIRRLRRGLIAWWVPIVGAVVTMIATSICVAIPLMGDPAFMEYIARSAGS
ncbi:DUF6264 family protein [Microbacterium sp. NPDC089695]|uniref:DUF6264 family protein n=1 Tax=Microbacterium sp. NPDC089695 TaxID=3364198 RepID=UPI00381B8344